jgi:NAD(P)-dependent dehydrogenase (short-subunit alcohol dehydrogenase family)
MALPSPFKGYHHATYPATDPSRAELSLKGKNVIVTGGGGTIGSAVVGAFAEAGVSLIGIVGRNQKTLDSTKTKRATQYPHVNIVTATADVTDPTSIKRAFSQIREIAKSPTDILISNAGYQSPRGTITESEPREMVDGIRNQRQRLVQHASSVP